jgi:hypothetical protein
MPARRGRGSRLSRRGRFTAHESRCRSSSTAQATRHDGTRQPNSEAVHALAGTRCVSLTAGAWAPDQARTSELGGTPQAFRSCLVHPVLAPGIPCQIITLPAGITNRAGRFPPDSGAANVCSRAGHLYLYRPWPAPYVQGGLDLSASMFAPCSLGCPGTPRQHAVSTPRCGYKPPHRMAGPGRSRHLSIPVQREESNRAADS